MVNLASIDRNAKDVAQVEGDHDFSSNHPVMQKLNPRAYQVIWEFSAPTK
jgi:hypothetical protein